MSSPQKILSVSSHEKTYNEVKSTNASTAKNLFHKRQRSRTETQDEIINELRQIQLVRVKEQHHEEEIGSSEKMTRTIIPMSLKQEPQETLQEEKKCKTHRKLEVRAFSLNDCKAHYKVLIDEFKDRLAKINGMQSSNNCNEVHIFPSSSLSKTRSYMSFASNLVVGRIPFSYHPELDENLIITEKDHSRKLTKVLLQLMKADPFFSEVNKQILLEIIKKVKLERPDNFDILIKKVGVILEPIIKSITSLQLKLYTIIKKTKKKNEKAETQKKEISQFAVNLFNCLYDLTQVDPDPILKIDLAMFLQKVEHYRKKSELWKVVGICFGKDEKTIDEVIEQLNHLSILALA